MDDSNINPEKLTKPIQLLAAWLVGLLSISSSFLFAATHIEIEWLSAILVIAAIINVPLFLLAVFLLQTKFRPELQEDSYYSTYLSNKSNTMLKVTKTENSFHELNAKLEILEKELLSLKPKEKEEVVDGIESFRNLTFGVNTHVLEDADEIKSALFSKGVIKVTTFGVVDMERKRRVMSISKYLSDDIQKDLISLAQQLGMDSYNFFDNVFEETSEDVLIGSYGNGEYTL